MTDLDTALVGTTQEPVTATSTVTPRRCRRHEWVTKWGDGLTFCGRCGHVKDEQKARQGKRNRRLGGDTERRLERTYGWEKIGERGEKTDLRGKLFKVQSKASRRPAPALIRDTFTGLDATKDGRIPLLVLSFVRADVGTEDFVVLRGSDWLDLHGTDEP